MIALGRAPLPTIRCNAPQFPKLHRKPRDGHHTLRAASSSSQQTATSSEYTTIAACPVLAADGTSTKLTDLWSTDQRVVLALMTHFGDLSSFEFAQKLLPVLPTLEASGVVFAAVGLGDVANARKFAEMLSFPLDKLYADPTPTLYRALALNQGFAPDIQISAYLKLLTMLAGVGSPGTIQEVLRGYLGDRNSPPVFSGTNPFDVLGSGYQRPFELATLRLYNMQAVLSNWAALAPQDERLLTQQGGCLVMEGTRVLYKHTDSGILKYANVDDVVRAALSGKDQVVERTPTQVLRSFT